MARPLEITIDAAAITALSARFEQLDAAAFGELAVASVNDTADAVYELVVPRMTGVINLSPDYVRDRMEVQHATSADNARATIVASYRKNYMTSLARYQPRQVVVATRSGKGKGDASRGIAAGMKAAGVSVEVTRGARKMVDSGRSFLIKLNNGNGFGVATRHGAGRDNYRVRHGPSVYQLFKVAAEVVVPEATDMLEAELLGRVDKLMDEVFR